MSDSSSSSASEVDSSSSEEDEGAGFDFLGSLSSLGSSAVTVPLSRSSPVPEDEEDPGGTSGESEQGAEGSAEEPTPSSVEEQFHSVADELSSEFSRRQRGLAVERLREMKTRVGARLTDSLGGAGAEGKSTSNLSSW